MLLINQQLNKSQYPKNYTSKIYLIFTVSIIYMHQAILPTIHHVSQPIIQAILKRMSFNLL